MSDTVTLRSKQLSYETERIIIGLLIRDDELNKDQLRFARKVLQANFYEVADMDLKHLYEHIKTFFSNKKASKAIVPTEVDIRARIRDAHDFDPARISKFTNLLRECVLESKGVDADEIYQSMVETSRDKKVMNVGYKVAMAFDAKHNPLINRAGPEFEAQIRGYAEELKELVSPLREGAPSTEETLALLEKQEKDWEDAVKRRIPFIDKALNPVFMLTPGITLIGGTTKSGKSTILANLIPPILDYKPNQKVLIITCEDNLDMVATRIACCICEAPIKIFRLSPWDLPKEKVEHVKAVKRQLSERIVVVSENTTNVENVQSILAEAKFEDYSAILLDYYQVVNTSNKKRNADYIEVLKDFGMWLKAYAQELKVPFIMFAQLKPADKDVDRPFSQKVQGDTHIANHAHVSLEIRRAHDDGKGSLTEIYCELSRHSDRLGKIATFQFDGGKLKFVHEKAAAGDKVEVPPAKG
jgi:replicative DNA helicase